MFFMMADYTPLFGYILINIEIFKSCTSAKEEFKKIEIDACFEAYQHVLKQLKEMTIF